MWSIDRCDRGRGTQSWNGLAAGDRRLTFEETWRGWRSDEKFRDFWIASLREVPFEGYCWECPPVSDASRSRPFECVFVPSPSLPRMPPDPAAFGEHYHPGCQAVTFGNLGADAVLVAPCPAGAGDYGHLAQFARIAPRAQQQALWQAVGEAMEARVRGDPTWLSTAGHGVAWLHVRLDSSPKYYRHEPYRRV